jgi:hypothetical protein
MRMTPWEEVPDQQRGLKLIGHVLVHIIHQVIGR